MKKKNTKLEIRELHWIIIRLAVGIMLILLYMNNKYQIDKAYEIFDMKSNIISITYSVAMFITFIASITKCAKIELGGENITAKSIREERNKLKFESKLTRFVDFTKAKSWSLFLTAVGILVPNIIGSALCIVSLIIMVELAKRHKFKGMNIMLNTGIIGLVSIISRLVLV